MSDEADRPLTRRERRLREQAEAGAVSAVAESPAASTDASTDADRADREAPAASTQTVEAESAPVAPAPAAAPAATADEDEIEISPFNEDGTPRTRREIRALREEALAARAAAQSAAAAQAEPAPTVPEPPAPPVAPPDDSVREETDPRLSATQPLSLEDIAELAGGEPAEPEQAPEAPAGLEPIAAETAAAETAAAQPIEAEPAEAERSESMDSIVPEPIPAIPVDAESDAAPDVEAVEAEPIEAEPGPEGAAPESPSYSFPDIAPLDDNISVFDDPATRTVATPASDAAAGSGEGDFDDLISRAVAQEGAVGTTNSSALILPTLPDTGDLSGPLGGTGDLLVTGSLDLPKSLGETGGHAPLHDALDVDPLDELGFDTMPATGDPILPVSAARAVSAVGAEASVVTQQTKEKSKLPLALILTGGGLLIVVVGLVAWGATSGIFG